MALLPPPVPAPASPEAIARHAERAHAVRAVVSIPPLKGLIEPMLPRGSTVEVLIPAGVSEHGYEIPPGKLGLLRSCDLVVCVGRGMEPQVQKFLAANPSERRQAVMFDEVAPKDHDHDHAAPGHVHDGHEEHGSDPHFWLDPVLCQQMLAQVARSVKALRPGWTERSIEGGGASEAGAEVSESGSAKHLARLSALDGLYREALSPAKERSIVVAHDAYGWLARRYNLRTVALAGLNAAEPKPADLKRAIDQIREKKIAAVFAEPQLSPAAARRVAEATGAKILTLDPLGDGDYFKMMEANLKALCQGLGVPEPKVGSDAPGTAGKPTKQP